MKMLVLIWLQTAAMEPPQIHPGDVVAGHIDPSDSVVESPGLLVHGDAAVRGTRFRFRVPDAGAYFIDLRSHFFDPYLILRDSEGELLVEDDDGWFAVYPRIIVEGLVSDRDYYIDACALHGETGEFELRMTSGAAPLLSPEERDARSLREARKAVEVVAEALGAEHARVAARLDELAYFLNLQGRYDEALPCYERAIAICEKALGPEHPQTATTLHNLARLLAEDLRRPTDAVPVYERALTILLGVYGPEQTDAATCMHSLAGLLWDRGDYERAQPLFERALAARRKILGSRHVDTAATLEGLANLLWSIGSYEQARPLYEEAVSIHKRVHGRRHPLYARSLNYLGMLLQKLGERDEAKELFEHALAIAEGQLGAEHSLTTATSNNLARLLQEEGRYKEAREIFERVLTIREKTLAADHPSLATSLNNLAMLLVDLEDYDTARSSLERALAMERKLFGVEHPSTVLRLSNLSLVHEKRGDLAAAMELEMESLGARRRLLERLLPVLSESERFRWMGRQRRSLDHVLSLSVDLKSRPDIAYREVLYWKGLVSRGLLQNREWIAEQVDASIVALQEELGRTVDELSAVFFDDSGSDEQRVSSLEALRSRRDQIEKDLARRAAAQSTAFEVDLDLDRVCGMLGEQEALLDFLIYADSSGNQKLAAFVLRAGIDIQRVELGLIEAVREELGVHLRDIASSRGVRAAEPSGLRPVLWDPLAPHLGAAKRIFICPDGELATLPFETLPGAEEGTYLLETMAFVYLQSALDLESRETPLGEGALLVGGVDYDSIDGLDPDGARVAVAVSPSDTRAFQRPFFPLDATVTELQAIAYLYKRRGAKPAAAVVLTGGEASEERVKLETRGKRYVHLATHGFFAPDGVRSILDAAFDEDLATRGAEFDRREETVVGLLPGFLSGVVLSGANLAALPEGTNGVLTAEEVSWMDLSGCDLVTLSACETGLGTPRGGEHLIGLRRALRLAGARSTVTSLWKVSDSATQQLMQDFYRRLWTGGKGKLEALRGAQLAMLANNRARNGGQGLPGTWGAFVLEGEWR